MRVRSMALRSMRRFGTAPSYIRRCMVGSGCTLPGRRTRLGRRARSCCGRCCRGTVTWFWMIWNQDLMTFLRGLCFALVCFSLRLVRLLVAFCALLRRCLRLGVGAWEWGVRRRMA